MKMKLQIFITITIYSKKKLIILISEQVVFKKKVMSQF